jgi:SAM-dependent methyltransferase
MQASTSGLDRGWRSTPVGIVARAGYRAARAAYDVVHGGALDLADSLTGRRRPLTPPRRLWHLVTGRSNTFHESGEELRGFLISQGLQPEHRVLDVGCGIGRLAVPLTAYLNASGGYEGFDIMPQAIRWCQRINAAYPNFRFQLADVHSDRYHPRGQVKASEYVFPYESGSFDFVVLGSVFSHMFPADLSNYLSEIARVMKPGGKAVISCYLLNARKREAIAAGGGVFTFTHPGPGYWAEFAELPEAAIAYEEDWMLALYDRCGLEVVENREGVWATQLVQGQDVVISVKR